MALPATTRGRKLHQLPSALPGLRNTLASAAAASAQPGLAGAPAPAPGADPLPKALTALPASAPADSRCRAASVLGCGGSCSHARSAAYGVRHHRPFGVRLHVQTHERLRRRPA